MANPSPQPDKFREGNLRAAWIILRDPRLKHGALAHQWATRIMELERERLQRRPQ